MTGKLFLTYRNINRCFFAFFFLNLIIGSIRTIVELFIRGRLVTVGIITSTLDYLI
jgi:hypothetical protein